MAQSTLRRVIVALLPPIVTDSYRALRRKWNPPLPILEFSPRGWDEGQIVSSSSGWNAESVVEATRAENVESIRLLLNGGPLGIGHQHNLHASFAYVLARAAHNKGSLSVLDWGSGLGYYYYVAKAALPEVDIDFHCNETATLAAAGRQVVPEATWYADTTRFDRQFDVVMLSGSLQCLRDWKDQLRAVAGSAAEWLYITRLPVVDRVPTFAAVQRVYGSVMLHWQFNRAEVLSFVESLGFEVEREFEIGDRPDVKNAPEPCELRGWLFRRVKPK